MAVSIIDMMLKDLERGELHLSGQLNENESRELYLDITSKYDGIINNLGNSLYGYYPEGHFYEKNISNKSLNHNLKVLINKLKIWVANYSQETNGDIKKKQNKIFISHSTKDKAYVELIVDLLREMGISSSSIICSSVPGCDIPIDYNICEFLRDQFFENNLRVLFVHSDNYYESAISLNEMGAAWALKTSYTSILLPGFSFNSMKGVFSKDKVSIKLDNDETEVKDKLNQLYDKLVCEYNLQVLSKIEWEDIRDSFIKNVNDEYKNNGISKATVLKRSNFGL